MLQQIVYHCIIRPALRFVLTMNPWEERFELSVAGMHSATETPLAILITITPDIARQLLIANPAICIRLPRCKDYHGRLLFVCLRHGGQT